MNRLQVSSAIGLAMTLLGLAMSGQYARAQSDAPPPPPTPGRDVFYMRVGPGPMGADDAIGFVGFEEGLGGETVTSAPFSATISTQTTQVLADGNRIERTTTGAIARDSQGRTRRDMTLPAIGSWDTSGKAAPHVIFINDSVAGTQYILQPDRKIARKVQWMRRGKHGDEMPPGAQIITRSEGGGPGNGTNVSTTSLGTQTINGVQAVGTRTTHTIPAGAIGNVNPIVITNERWYSTELQTVVMIKRSDPRMGETTFQLTNIQKQEPDASLFQVPPDYTVKQGGPGGRKHFRNRGGAAPPALPPTGDAQSQPPSTSHD